MNTATRRYLLAWALLGATTLTATLAVDPVPPHTLVPLLVMAAAVWAAGRIELDFDFERTRTTFTIVEVAATAGLLLVGPGPAVVAVVVGTALAHVSRRLAPTKVLFNTAVIAVAASLAGAVMAVTPGVGPEVGGRPVLGVAAGMVGYVTVNLLAILGLLRRLGGTSAVEGMRDQLPLTVLTTVGQIATGIVAAVVTLTEPLLTPLVLAPVGAIHLAATGATRTTSLLTAVRADRDRLTRVVDGASDGILLLDAAGEIRVWNPAMASLTGIPGEQAIGRPVAAVLTDRVRVGATTVRGRWLVDVAHDGPAQRDLDAELHHLDGSHRAIQESHALVFDERGRCTGDVVVVRDVSRQQELERLRSDFVARVSHELRTPLTPIRGFASVLLRRGDRLPSAQRHDALARILERADHLETLVEDLLLVTRVDQGEIDDLVHVRPVAIDEIAVAAVDRALVKDPERPVAARTAPGTPTVLADPERLGQVLDALLDNACRYSPAGTPVEVLVDHAGEDVRIRVSDHGNGIPRDQREAIFERFHRIEDPLTMRTGGVGLGLFLARQLTLAMHGSVEVDPADSGGGSTFVVRLPTSEPAEAGGQQSA